MSKVEICIDGVCALNESSETLQKKLSDDDFIPKLQQILNGTVAIAGASISVFGGLVKGKDFIKKRIK